MNRLYENRDKKLNSCMLQTDLSSAFDTIDHTILIERLDYYGVRGMELNILCNMMNNRRQFVELDTFPSTVTKIIELFRNARVEIICIIIFNLYE